MNNKELMSIKEYLASCGIEHKTLDDSTPEQQVTGKIMDEELYYDMFYENGVDHLIDCVDYGINLEIFTALSREAKKYQDIFEPCCRSGILGGYLALNNPHYHGMDINPVAITRAQDLARRHGLYELIFEEGDVLMYERKHEAVIGRFVAHNWNRTIDNDMIKALCRISPHIVLVQSELPELLTNTMNGYNEVFSHHGYKVGIPAHIGPNPRSGEHVFLLSAERKL
jgi:hypothetical protein